jgi:hypothetical protein
MAGICRSASTWPQAGALNNLGLALTELRRFEEAIDAHTRAATAAHGACSMGCLNVSGPGSGC